MPEESLCYTDTQIPYGFGLTSVLPSSGTGITALFYKGLKYLHYLSLGL